MPVYIKITYKIIQIYCEIDEHSLMTNLSYCAFVYCSNIQCLGIINNPETENVSLSIIAAIKAAAIKG